MSLELHTCQRCQKNKPADEFQRNRHGLTATCRKCRRQHARSGVYSNDEQPASYAVFAALLETIGQACIAAAASFQNIADKENTSELR